MASESPNKSLLFRLLDSTDRTADCLALGILLGFLCFTSLIVIFAVVFAAHSFWPHRVELDAGSFAAAAAGLGGAYSAVLGATTAAYRWRKHNDGEKE
jgi:hypothetical protein